MIVSISITFEKELLLPDDEHFIPKESKTKY